MPQNELRLFDRMKWQLVVIVCSGLVLLMSVDHITTQWLYQLLLLLGFSFIAVIWIIVRAQFMVYQHLNRKGKLSNEPLQNE
ncbi:MAG: hypothetical protein HWD59_08200 [Coxiellaceae bacterium]|nr:MAG: hypothetical protein HWD59_08200 [Coxiellaceae bacterium]